MAEILKEKGNEAFKAQDYTTADKLYQDAITLDPENPILYSNRSMTLIKLESWNDCIKVVDVGLIKNPDNKTKVKLLWRKGSALIKINEFLKAREILEIALNIDKNNKSVLNSIKELDLKESQFKRSHSIDEFDSDKRVKTQNLIKIPIFEVDELPIEFTSVIKKQEIIIQNPIPKKQLIHEVNEFPEVPTINTLISITNSNNSSNSLNYIFNISSNQYLKLFKNGNIDHKILNLILDSIIYSLESDLNTNLIKSKDLLINLPKIPRFNLVQLFIDKSKLQKIKQLMNNSNEVDLWY